MDEFYKTYNNIPIVLESVKGNKHTFTWLYVRFTVTAIESEAFMKAYQWLIKNRY